MVVSWTEIADNHSCLDIAYLLSVEIEDVDFLWLLSSRRRNINPGYYWFNFDTGGKLIACTICDFLKSWVEWWPRTKQWRRRTCSLYDRIAGISALGLIQSLPRLLRFTYQTNFTKCFKCIWCNLPVRCTSGVSCQCRPSLTLPHQLEQCQEVVSASSILWIVFDCRLRHNAQEPFLPLRRIPYLLVSLSWGGMMHHNTLVLLTLTSIVS